ncbi:hypothetical protein LshimejAT787_1000740 [Lyophyllum shimeji]|uniref:MYND-type domain-containing protein n=1 Tax=Lyophyllum shimeji TaxID=47721 RepID=A0A9P3PTY3_LYOSH|nr:hypothetical protein LshimejAT787_1000740 [Lyophyllum shimeji]
MGIKLPKTTKIPDDDLSKRLNQALDGAQRFNDLLGPISPLNPSTLDQWASSKPLLEAVSRGSLNEAYRNMMDGYHRKARPTSSAKEDTFTEVRQVLMGFANHYDQGHKLFALKDKQEEWCIIARIVEIFSLGGDPKVPLFTMLYKVVHRPSNMTLIDHLGDIFGNNEVVAVSTTDLERRCVLKLFAMNSKRLSAAYKPRREKMEADHRLTFVLPLAPLNMRDLGKLNNMPGCEICGKKNTSRCTQCLSVAYCGKDCQREHWKEHKGVCRSLKGGSWHPVTFTLDMGNLNYRFVLNRFDSMHDMQSKIEQTDPNTPPPNIHGDKAFLVKFQISLTETGSNTHMLLYDRQKSFQVYWKKAADPKVFAEGEKAMGDRLKIYRWARRVGDFQLAVIPLDSDDRETSVVSRMIDSFCESVDCTALRQRDLFLHTDEC